MLKTVSSIVNAIGALNYQGTWDASTNTPTLTSGVGTKGDYYVVSVAGTTNLDGTTLWGVGDWAVFNGTIWQKVDGGSTGDFTNVSISGTLTLSGGTANAVTYLNTSKVVTTGTALQFNGATLGVGVTPQTWWATRKALQVGTLAALASDSSTVAFTSNIYNDAGGTATYLTTAAASAYYQTGGQHLWYSAASGTAGNAVTLTQRMGLDASGNLTLNAGTANGVAYLNASNVLTTGSALTFDGTNFATTGSISATGNMTVNGSTGYNVQVSGGNAYRMYATVNDLVFRSVTAGSDVMTLTYAGRVGIGTSSPSARLTVAETAGYGALLTKGGDADRNFLWWKQGTVNWISGFRADPYSWVLEFQSASGTPNANTGWTNVLTATTSGNLGLGVTPNASWSSTSGPALQIGPYTSVFNNSYLGSSEIAYNTIRSGNDAYVYGSSSVAASRLQQRDGAFRFFTAAAGTAGNAITFTQAMTLDASGNLGLGVTPSAWLSGGNAQFKKLTFAGNDYSLGSNYYQDSGGYKYVNTETAAKLSFYNGQFLFYTAPSGTAGNAITFTQAMTLDASGNLGIGTTSPGYRLDVQAGPSGTANQSFINFARTSGASSGYGDYLQTGGTATGAWFGRKYLTSPGWVSSIIGSNAIVFSTGDIGSETERARIDSNGNVQVGTAAIATNATNGFFYIPTCAGTPTGTPTAKTGLAPMVIDSTNNKMYIYSGGAWVALN